MKFKRTPTLKALPIPQSTHDCRSFDERLAPLWSCVNIPCIDDQRCVLVWLLDCFFTQSPFPVLVIEGEQGSAKSTTQAFLQALIDPSTIHSRSAPARATDIFVTAANNYLVAYNNISTLKAAEQDTLCVLATGGGFATRAYYTNFEEATISLKRPVLLNGIGPLVTAPDLLDRCLVIQCPAIAPHQRCTSTALHQRFQAHYSALLETLLDILVAVLHHLPTIQLNHHPRMADFATLGQATEKAMGWPEGSFQHAYHAKCQQGLIDTLDNQPVIHALCHHLRKQPQGYQGSLHQLWQILQRYQTHDVAQSLWPTSTRGFVQRLKHYAPALRSAGFSVHFDTQRHKNGYHVHIKSHDNDTK